MTKTEVKNRLDSILLNHKASAELSAELQELVASFGRKEGTAPKLEIYLKNEAGEVTHRYCTFHKEYETVDSFFNYQKESECKIGIRNWREYSKLIKQVDESINQIKDSVLDGVNSPENAKALIAEELKEKQRLEQDRKNKILIIGE